MTKPLYILNGPNLNLLGTREPEIYGTTTLAAIEKSCEDQIAKSGIPLVFRQTNAQGELVDWIQEAGRAACALILNAGAYTHSSIAVFDALNALSLPVIELHLSNPAAREAFRRTNYVAPAATASICGLGAKGYQIAVTEALRLANIKT